MSASADPSAMLVALVVSAALGLSCSGEPGPKPGPGTPSAAAAAPRSTAAEPAAPGPTAPGQPAPDAQGCGPEIEGQADNVRAAVLESLIRKSVEKGAAAGSAHGPIVIGEEQRLPGGQVFVHDASPGVTALFANHTPPVGGYSSGFSVQGGRTVQKNDLLAFTTGDICWTSGGRAVVKARTIAGDANTRWSATVQRTGADWVVIAIEPRR